MKTFLTVLLILHIASGITALVTGGIASLTRKGGKGHRRSGKVYFWAMTGVFITATAIGILKSLLFLFMVGFFSYYFVVRGYRVLYLKGLGRSQKATGLDWAISVVALLFGIGLIGFAGHLYAKSLSFWPVPLVFGSISTGFAVADMRLYIKGPKTKQHWLTGHIASMGGGYIATWTAFVVTNVRFLPPVIVWLLPGAIGTFFIIRSIRRYVPKPKAVAVKAAVAALLLFAHFSCDAQAVYGTLNLAGLGQNLYVQLQAAKTDTSFLLQQRLLPGAGSPLLYAENVTVNNAAVAGRLVIFGAYRYRFNGTAAADSVQLQLLDTAGKSIGRLTASARKPERRPAYTAVTTQIIDTFQRYLFNKAYLDSAGWKSFAATLKQYAFFLQDDLEFMGAVNREMRKLPFTHCSFTKADYDGFAQMVNRQFSGTRPIEAKTLPNNTAYLKITSFDGDGSNIAAAMESIIKSKAAALIIDLRGNRGGGAGAALQLLKYLSPVYTPGGALVTNRWFDTARRAPVLADYKNFYTFSNGSTLQLIDALKTAAGVVLAVKPAAQQYKGDLYLLTDGYTASTCEPLVYGLKSRGRATVVGGRTAGAMLSAGGFWLNTGYVLSLPVADYFTYDGVRLDKVGVAPSVEAAPAAALDKAMELITGK